jgi:hypothetical protein
VKNALRNGLETLKPRGHHNAFLNDSEAEGEAEAEPEPEAEAEADILTSIQHQAEES